MIVSSRQSTALHGCDGQRRLNSIIGPWAKQCVHTALGHLPTLRNEGCRYKQMSLQENCILELGLYFTDYFFNFDHTKSWLDL